MGIDKADGKWAFHVYMTVSNLVCLVRFVIHFDLPKNMDG
jgi:superfamily II DNA helicase RecQ